MPIIIPAILEQDNNELKRKLFLATQFARKIQIDIADGLFVPNKTISFAQAFEIVKNLKIDIEWHLMVANPLDLLDSLNLLASSTVVFHFEAVSDPKKTIQAIKNAGHAVGIALNPETPGEVIDTLCDKISLVTVMSVDPGFQGSPFVLSALKKIEELKKRFPKLTVEIDGGVNESNLIGVAATGVDQIVMGSGIWKTANPEATFKQLTIELSKVV